MCACSAIGSYAFIQCSHKHPHNSKTVEPVVIPMKLSDQRITLLSHNINNKTQIFTEIVEIYRAFCVYRTRNGAERDIQQKNMLNWADIRKRIDAVASTIKRAHFG